VATDQLTMTFAALADPTRRSILVRLSDGEATGARAAHRPRRSAQLRPSRLQGQALKEAADWLADYRGFWEDSFDRLEEHLHEVQRGPRQ
jgi:DNA-binding transcriptional ArsR family regulator